MSWAKLDSIADDHPKVEEAVRLSDGGAWGLIAALWCRANRHPKRRGFLLDGTIEAVMRAKKYRPKHRRALETVGLLEPVEGGAVVHDFDDYQPPRDVEAEAREDDDAEKRRAAARERMRRVRAVRSEQDANTGERSQDVREQDANTSEQDANGSPDVRTPFAEHRAHVDSEARAPAPLGPARLGSDPPETLASLESPQPPASGVTPVVQPTPGQPPTLPAPPEPAVDDLPAREPTKAERVEASHARYAAAYGRGISKVTEKPFVMPTRDRAELATALPSVAPGLRNQVLDEFIEAEAERYARATLPDVRFQCGFSVKKFLEWRNAPATRPGTPPRASVAPQPQPTAEQLKARGAWSNVAEHNRQLLEKQRRSAEAEEAERKRIAGAAE